MRSKMARLFFLLALLGGTTLATTTMASEAYIWTTGANSITFNNSFFDTNGDNAFYISNVSNSDSALVVKSGIPSALIVISGDTTNGFKATVGAEEVTLGSTASFMFKFSDDNTHFSYVYDYTNTGNLYTYKNSSTNTEVSMLFSSTPTVSAVPIPGSALLLGSSLLGLVGISSRRKKA